MRDLNRAIWWDGEIVSSSTVGLSPFDQGVLTGDGLFETLVGRRGEPFAVTRHWRRLSAAAGELGLKAPSLETMRTGLREVMAGNGMTDARLRVTLTRGEMLPGLSGDSVAQGRLWMMATPLRQWPALETVVVCPWAIHSSGALAGLKSLSYATQLRAMWEAQQRGAGECLIANERDELCEGSGSNVFLVRDGALWTPELESGCLPGVTRALVLEQTAKLGLTVHVGAVPMEWIRAGAFDELFLTSSTRGVQPVGQMEGWKAAQAGEVTRQLQEAYRQLERDVVDP